MTTPLQTARAKRIVEEDVSFRTRMLEISSGLTDVIAMGRGDPDFHTPQHIVAAAKRAIDDNQHCSRSGAQAGPYDHVSSFGVD